MMKRIKSFAIRSIKVSESLPAKIEANVFKTQLVRSASSAAANYRAVRRARSRNEFFSKVSIVIEELDESLFWLEMIIDVGFQTLERLQELIKEGYELLSILAKARKSTKQ
ncbi:four helix bundle protein [Emticicia sp. TH156]|nr:four helix bundle protein [Emticicia sp. TH156]